MTERLKDYPELNPSDADRADANNSNLMSNLPKETSGISFGGSLVLGSPLVAIISAPVDLRG